MRKVAMLLAAIVVVLVAIYALGVLRNEDQTGLQAHDTATTATIPTIPKIPTIPTAAAAPASDAAPAAAAVDGAATTDAAIDATLGDHAQYRRVFAALQAAVNARDAQAVAALVHYPFGAAVDGKTKVLEDAAAFVQHYDAIVTPAIARVVTAQQYADLFVNYKGVMLGNGEVWINGICRDDACKQSDVRVVTIQPGPDEQRND